MTKPHFQADENEIQQLGDNYLIKPRGLSIVWGNDERYWKIPAPTSTSTPTPTPTPTPTETTSPTVEDFAELVQVSWLEVTGSIGLKPGKYELTFDVELKPDAFGWKDIQAFLMAKVGKRGKYTWSSFKVQQPDGPDQTRGRFTIPPAGQKLSIEVPDADDKILYFGLYEVWSRKWKGGLKIYNAKVTAH